MERKEHLKVVKYLPTPLSLLTVCMLKLRKAQMSNWAQLEENTDYVANSQK
jgi:hypothetical protein